MGDKGPQPSRYPEEKLSYFTHTYGPSLSWTQSHYYLLFDFIAILMLLSVALSVAQELKNPSEYMWDIDTQVQKCHERKKQHHTALD